MEPRNDIAINAVRDWLIDLLKENKWCQAKRIGKALEILIEDNRPTTAETPDYGIRQERIG